MSKKVTIKEQEIEEPVEESREEIVQQISNPTPPEPQKADARMRVRELYKCDDCGKYLTKNH